MSDELLPYYQRELSFIRTMGAAFADTHPKIAGRLRLRAEGAHDPHVERMIEAFAYLNARTRHKLEDDFPEITDALLNVLYPQYLAPIPSMAIAKFELGRSQSELTSGYEITRHAPLETAPIDGQPCRFETCYPVKLWPVEMRGASLASAPFVAPATPFNSKSAAVVRLSQRCLSKDVTFAQLEMPSQRFYLQGQQQHAYLLYELIFNNAIGVALANSAGDDQPVVLDRKCITPVGFGRDEGMLPYANRTFAGYRLLSEFFTFPEKLLFFDLSLASLTAAQRDRLANSFEIYLYLDRAAPELERIVDANTFQLGCSPIVNLFRKRAEPIPLTHTEFEYRVVPDARRPLATEVYSVDRVVATSQRNEEVEYQPFFSFKHASANAGQQTFWQATRRPAVQAAGTVDDGTEVFISLVDLGFKPTVPADWTLDIETTCLNRDLPHRASFDGNQAQLQLTNGGPLSQIKCLTPLSPTYRPSLKHGATWKLISHLSLNHLSLCDNEDGADALREILKLYDFSDSEETRSMISGLLSLRTRRVVGRTANGVAGGLCRGIEVTAHLDEERFVGSGVYLFACVLERFLGLYSSINSFSKLIATTNKRESALRRWPPRAGEQTLL